MTCEKCGSTNVNVQLINEQILVKKRRGLLFWLLIGWWLEPILWLCFFGIRLFFALFAPKRSKIKNISHSVAVCQNCGYQWTINKRELR